MRMLNLYRRYFFVLIFQVVICFVVSGCALFLESTPQDLRLVELRRVFSPHEINNIVNDDNDTATFTKGSRIVSMTFVTKTDLVQFSKDYHVYAQVAICSKKGMRGYSGSRDYFASAIYWHGINAMNRARPIVYVDRDAPNQGLKSENDNQYSIYFEIPPQDKEAVDLCFTLSGVGTMASHVSNEVVLTREAVAIALEK
jgi:hypothetical protein